MPPVTGMDYLWSPWRYRYVSEAVDRDGCLLCEIAADTSRDRERLILRRARFNFVLLNRFPYTTGHTMVAPYAHVRSLSGLEPEALKEMMTLAQDIEGALKSSYQPDGYNLGMNLGRSAGAGVADHLHLHILPRWEGDTSFMTAVGETRILPEDLSTTYERLAGYFRQKPV